MKKVIDVSYWQKSIDWDAVVAAGVGGVIVKITEGSTIEDTWWMNVKNAEEHGLPWGVYCYGHAQTPEEAREEANEVIYLLNSRLPWKIPELGIWYDVEDDPNYKSMFNEGVDTTACASAFIVACNEAGYSAGIYTSSMNCTDYQKNSVRPNELADYVPYWIADYRGYCGFKHAYPDKRLYGWQYSDREYIGDTNVDMNEWYD